MFPDDSFGVTPFQPLDCHAFREKVLLPECGTLLIRQDFLHISHVKAIKIMCNSQDFGSLFHPGTDSRHVDDVVRRTCSSQVETEAPVKKEVEEMELVNPDSEYKEVLEAGKIVILLDD
jgi:hypothetical protein